MLETFIIAVNTAFLGFCIGYGIAKHKYNIKKRTSPDDVIKLSEKKKADINFPKYRKELLKKLLKDREKKAKKKENP